KTDEVHLLEIGFGTGLNCLLSYFNHHKPVKYVGVEAFPLEQSVLAKLNYTEWLNYRDSKKVFNLLHSTQWNEPATLNPDFQLIKLDLKVEALNSKDLVVFDAPNLIYFDAFAPTAQPELWTPAIFEKMFELLAPGGVLVTYFSNA